MAEYGSFRVANVSRLYTPLEHTQLTLERTETLVEDERDLAGQPVQHDIVRTIKVEVPGAPEGFEVGQLVTLSVQVLLGGATNTTPVVPPAEGVEDASGDVDRPAA